MLLNIYVASSWRNTHQPWVVDKLRVLGHAVYDFRGGGDGWHAADGVGGFGWESVDSEWFHWTPSEYIEALRHPLASEGFERDMSALRKCDACVMVMPCGPSASMEMGWAVGAGKRVAVFCPGIREPDLMVKMAHFITDRWDSIELWLSTSSLNDGPTVTR
jgi:hypothetical protein